MKCPNCDVDMTSDKHKNIEFEDVEGEYIYISVTANWCTECLYYIVF